MISYPRRIGSLWDDVSDVASGAWSVVSHPADDVTAVYNAVTDPAKAIADTTKAVVDDITPIAAAGVGGVAGAILGGIAGCFVMNPALGAQLGWQLGTMIGAGAATVDPDDVKAGLSAGVIALYDEAGNLLAGDPSKPAVGFMPKKQINVGNIHAILRILNPPKLITHVADKLRFFEEYEAKQTQGATNVGGAPPKEWGKLLLATIVVVGGIAYLTR